jgi:HAMP domain-containing protein
LRRASESAGLRPRVRFGLRPRLLGALVLTAVVTLATAAFTLLAPLQSRLRADSEAVATTLVEGQKTAFGYIPLLPNGHVNIAKIRSDALSLDRATKYTVIVWDAHLRRLADTDPDRDARIPPTLARGALHHRKPQTRVDNGVFEVAARYHGQGLGKIGPLYVLEMLVPLNYVDQANTVVRSTVFDAALVGLAVALLLGITLSSRLLRRLRLLQDASRTLDERDLGTLVVPHEMVTDEIGELARAFATMHARLRQQEEARRAFVATASHELRTPLTSLDGMLELLADDLNREPIDLVDARERVARAQQQSRRLGGLASDLLDLSRLDAALELRSEPVELGGGRVRRPRPRA